MNRRQPVHYENASPILYNKVDDSQLSAHQQSVYVEPASQKTRIRIICRIKPGKVVAT